MSQSQDKRFRKAVRKRVDENFGKGMEALGNIIRPRPTWIPKRVWILAYVLIFPRQYLRLIYKHMK